MNSLARYTEHSRSFLGLLCPSQVCRSCRHSPEGKRVSTLKQIQGIALSTLDLGPALPQSAEPSAFC